MAGLTIGAVAERTGVGVPVLRAWESRYGFPAPARTPSGQRRYRQRDVEAILRVVADRGDGLSLEAAVERARRMLAVDQIAPSLFAGLRRHHPDLAVHVLSTRTMLAISRAIEDECCAQAERPVLLAAFQEVRHYRKAEVRWREMSRTAAASAVFADFPVASTPAGGPIEVPLHPQAPLRREWAVVCDAPDSAGVLAGWERPGPPDQPEADRRFEAVWSADPMIVRRAARVGVALAEAAVPEAAGLSQALSDTLGDPRAALLRSTALTNRIVAYLDHPPARRSRSA